MGKLLLLCALLLAGCAEMPRTTYHWTKAGGDMPTMNADWQNCVGTNSFNSRVADTNAEGGQILHADGVDPGRAVECMKARGYTLDNVAPT